MNIGGVDVGPGHPAYVIAEIGSNHDGDLSRALELIDTAADCGADCAKFQLYRADKLYPGTITPGAIPDEWLPELQAASHRAGIEFMCSVFCSETLAAYMEIEPAAIKIASPEALNTRLLAACLETDLPLIISTGAMTEEQLRDLAHLLPARRVALLHCVSAYPPQFGELNLRVIGNMGDWYEAPVVVGFSDHTLDELHVPTLAVAVGASIIEKHLTYSRAADGPDHPFALEPAQFEDMVDAIREVETMLGDGVKRVMPSEDPTDRRQAA